MRIQIFEAAKDRPPHPTGCSRCGALKAHEDCRRSHDRCSFGHPCVNHPGFAGWWRRVLSMFEIGLYPRQYWISTPLFLFDISLLPGDLWFSIGLLPRRWSFFLEECEPTHRFGWTWPAPNKPMRGLPKAQA